MAKESIADKVSQIIRPVVEQLGYTLWDTVYAKEGADYHLVVTIDSESGITIEDCEKVHRAIDPILDETDPIEDSYYLDVSSPGVERVIRTDEHLAWAVGQRCEVKLFSPVEGKKTIAGVPVSFDRDALVMSEGEKELTIPRSAISRMNILFF